MRYSICYLLKGEVKKFYQDKVKLLADRFNERYLLDEPYPGHVTLKYPFEIDDIDEVEDVLLEIVNEIKKEKIFINKIDQFNNKVIFLKVEFSDGALKIFEKLREELRKLEKIEWRDYDKDLENKFHATLVYCNDEDKFEKMYNYALKIKPNFEIELDNITILKKKFDKKWKVHKIFEI